MNKSVIALLFFLLVAGNSQAFVVAQTTASVSQIKDETVPIDLALYENGVPAGAPRSPAIIPLSAEYDVSLQSIILTFRSDCGFVEVEAENTTTMEYYSCSGNSSSSIWLPISNSTGAWIVTVSLPDNREDVDEFTI